MCQKWHPASYLVHYFCPELHWGCHFMSGWELPRTLRQDVIMILRCWYDVLRFYMCYDSITWFYCSFSTRIAHYVICLLQRDKRLRFVLISHGNRKTNLQERQFGKLWKCRPIVIDRSCHVSLRRPMGTWKPRWCVCFGGGTSRATSTLWPTATQVSTTVFLPVYFSLSLSLSELCSVTAF
jgi:hypothetical protein